MSASYASKAHRRREECFSHLEVAGLFLWLLKDLGWVLLLPMLCMPAAFLVVCVECRSITLRWDTATQAQLVHSIVVALWLAGNALWMTSELLWMPSPDPGRQFPWFHGPILGERPHYYDVGQRTAQVIFLASVIALVVFYMHSAFHIGREDDSKRVSGREADEPLVFGLITADLYQWIFIGPWIAKDLCWTFDAFLPSVPFAIMVIALTVDYVVRFRRCVFVAELGWVIANTVWIYGELPLDDLQKWPRYVAASLLVVSACLVLVSLCFERQPSTTGHSEDTTETTRLLAPDNRLPGGD
mmetsp:Transcript_29703/g.94653  ORF Transcript_29703/g.94653 Transcript_29703/m.94653 type:complete len:300 (-) Transcript_29703:183-1082(-)